MFTTWNQTFPKIIKNYLDEGTKLDINFHQTESKIIFVLDQKKKSQCQPPSNRTKDCLCTESEEQNSRFTEQRQKLRWYSVEGRLAVDIDLCQTEWNKAKPEIAFTSSRKKKISDRPSPSQTKTTPSSSEHILRRNHPNFCPVLSDGSSN